jgi:hypothetical protein
MFTEIELAPDDSPAPSAEQILEYLLAPDAARATDAERPALRDFVFRYREVTKTPGELPFAPKEPTILEKLIWPLRHAKGSYALANYLGCIALCGMVGEMVAVLLWDISKVPLGDHPMSEDEQDGLFGRTFEKLPQERRTRVLRSLKLIDRDTKDAFDRLRSIRNKYLHLLSQTHERFVADAQSAYESSLKLVAVVLGQTFQDGKVVLRPDLMAYLVERGIVRPD